jgi:membrane fusion protein (multidrug efflux system)
VDIRVEAAAPAVFVPLDCILGFGENPYVYTVLDGRAQRKTVTIGRLLEEDAEVKEGLSVGDRVVVAGQEYLKEGLPIQIVEDPGAL